VAADPCVNTPPATASWSYWYAPRGGSWTYSSEGASTRDPAPGTVEGWAFGDGARPGVNPPARPAAPPPPPPPPRQPPRPPAPARTTGAGGGGAPPVATTPARATPSISSTGGPSAVTVTESTVDDVVLPRAESGRGAWPGFALGVGAVLLLAALGGWTIHRRRQRTEE